MAPPQAEGFRRSSLGQRHSTAIAAGLVSLLLLKQLLVLAGTLWEEACGINRESFFPGKKKYNVRQRGQGSRAGRRVARAQAGARAAGLPRWSSSVGVVLSSSQELVHKARGRDFWQRVPSGGLSHAQVAQGFLGDPTGVIWDHAGSPTACSYRAYLQLLALSVPVHKALLGWSIHQSFMAREMGTQRQVLGMRAPRRFPSGGWKWAPLSPRWGHLIHSRFKVGRKKIKTDSKGPLVVSIQCGFPIVSAPQCGFELCPSALSLEGPGWELGYLQTETQ